ncbi:MarR family transcriptional regulator [Phyllobacterium myrsinacearum]|uniref:MarR family transcriptional regulator n=2 Tax=Phyllobacterium myrsinacearum TaxID=28101 RepID=A0A2S9JX63_9HYPH|nr:MarR family transcriptional regulator [Phyllobacterium myrsinacearum]PWV96114.1 MarR family transcriptional regulator [Phyllobacterium myrsinacearum]RZV09896.1 MarR family transcriptional regulator [Phyllobacterium myrsinacearum]
MNPMTPRDTYIDELSKVSRKIRTLFDARVKQRGLTFARARTMMLLDRMEILSQKDLAEELEIETPTMVRLLDGLEKQGFIERRSVDGDRRAKQIVMTPLGAELASEVNQLAQELRAEFLKGVDEKALVAGLEVMRAINRNIGDMDKDPAG